MKEQYSISDLESISGIKAHTIRIWEQRYALFNPERTETNIRLYTDSDLRKLLNIGTLQRYGWKISKLGKLTADEITSEIKNHKLETVTESNFIQDSIDELILHTISMDENGFNAVFSIAENQMGFQKMIGSIIFPMLVKIGLLWNADEIMPSQEHFITNIIKFKIAVATDKLPPIYTYEYKPILFTPETEMHDIGLLMVNYLLRSQGIPTLYLGQSIPFENINAAAKISKSNALVCSITLITDKDKLTKYLRKLAILPSFDQFLVIGNSDLPEMIKLPSNITFVKNPANIHKYFLKNLN